MRRIVDYKLPLDGTEEERKRMEESGKPVTVEVPIDMPAGSKILRVNTRILHTKKTGIHPQTKQIGTFLVPEECVYLWAEVDDPPKGKTVPHTFCLVPTGDPVPEGLYVGTFLLQMGLHAYHVYLKVPTSE